MANQGEGAGKMILWSIFFFLVLGAVIWWSFTRHSVSGKVTATGATLGEWVRRPDACTVRSLATPKTFVLTDSAHPAWKMKVAEEDSNPPQISVASTSDDNSYLVDFDRCGINEVKVNVPPASGALDGHVKLDCMVGSSHLTADIEFQNCR
jgi:hypothetical protein